MLTRPLRTLLTAVLAIASLAAAGCGGGQVSADEVPGPPPALTVPTDSELGGGAADDAAEDSGTADESSDSADEGADTGTTDEGATDPSTTAPADESGGAAVPEATAAPEDSAANDTPPPAGSEAEQFEDFCAQNAGAC